MIGRVYKIIVSCSNEIYVGSTFNELRFRFQGHKREYDFWKNGKKNSTKTSSFELFEKWGIENCKIILIKEYEVIDRQHLEVYETLWINKLKSINKVNPFRVLNLSKKEYYKKTLERNPNFCKEQYKRAVERNPNLGRDRYQKKLENNPNYNNEHYRKRLENNPNHNKELYQKKLERNPNLNKEKITCECGLEVSKKSHARHRRSKKHTDRLNQ